jgi:hypothetical protein
MGISSFFIPKDEVIWRIITGVIAILVTSVKKKRSNLGPFYGERQLHSLLYS